MQGLCCALFDEREERHIFHLWGRCEIGRPCCAVLCGTLRRTMSAAVLLAPNDVYSCGKAAHGDSESIDAPRVLDGRALENALGLGGCPDQTVCGTVDGHRIRLCITDLPLEKLYRSYKCLTRTPGTRNKTGLDLSKWTGGRAPDAAR